MKLTRRQQEILDFVRKYILQNHFPPSIRDIASHFSLASAGGVHKHLNNLKKKGVLTFENNISRSIHILHEEEKATSTDLPQNLSSRIFDLPLMGKVAAGQPIEHLLENETIEIPESMIRSPAESYALQVKGDSMIEDCICDGDFVIVEHRNYADNGDTVIAMINHKQATLKKYFHEGDRIRLQPANFALEPIYVDPQSVSIHGRVIGVIRQYRWG
ncbi:MAG: transcriptional repressor LexA [SAR324 cluster bacterium]|nr:transcriptional repressor LexA [SAR324 cluster bacterium]